MRHSFDIFTIWTSSSSAGLREIVLIIFWAVMEVVASVRAATPTALCVPSNLSTVSGPRPAFCRVPAIRASQKPHGCSSSTPEAAKTLPESIHVVLNKITQNSTLRNAAFLAMNTLWAVPAIAAEAAEKVEEKGKIFDFNLTLPIIAAEFLLLMVALDNIWFKPVAKVMDERDEMIREKLMGVRDNTEEIKKLQEEAEAILKAARAETTAELNKMKKETAAALDKKLQESRDRIEKELADALANLEVQKQETLKSLDTQVQELSDEIIAKVIPFKI